MVSSCSCISQIQPAQTCVKLKISVDMLWRIPARDTIHLKTRKKRFRISSWGKYILVELFWNWKKIQIACLTTQDDNLTGVRTITKKALHMLNGQRQVPIQKAVHMLDNQEMVICSDRVTYISLAQGQAL